MRMEGLYVVLNRMLDALRIQWLGKTGCEGFFILIYLRRSGTLSETLEKCVRAARDLVRRANM